VRLQKIVNKKVKGEFKKKFEVHDIRNLKETEKINLLDVLLHGLGRESRLSIIDDMINQCLSRIGGDYEAVDEQLCLTEDYKLNLFSELIGRLTPLDKLEMFVGENEGPLVKKRHVRRNLINCVKLKVAVKEKILVEFKEQTEINVQGVGEAEKLNLFNTYIQALNQRSKLNTINEMVNRSLASSEDKFAELFEIQARFTDARKVKIFEMLINSLSASDKLQAFACGNDGPVIKKKIYCKV